MERIPPILQVGDVLVSSDILTQYFCCDLSVCKGACCIEGDAGAPVELDEVMEIENALDTVWGDLSATAQAVIDRQGVAYTDQEGDLVTSIVNGRDCVFTCYTAQDSADGGLPAGCCICALEKAFRAGKTNYCKPISCSLYPIRVKRFSNQLTGLNYHQWHICRCAVDKGHQQNIRLFQFLREPLVRRFGEEWYRELEEAARLLLA